MGGSTLQATEDRTLRLAEKASSCGQKVGHRERITGDDRGDDRYQKRRLERRPGSQVLKSRKSRPGPRASDATAIGMTRERCRIGRTWREGVSFGGTRAT